MYENNQQPNKKQWKVEKIILFIVGIMIFCVMGIFSCFFSIGFMDGFSEGWNESIDKEYAYESEYNDKTFDFSADDVLKNIENLEITTSKYAEMTYADSDNTTIEVEGIDNVKNMSFTIYDYDVMRTEDLSQLYKFTQNTLGDEFSDFTKQVLISLKGNQNNDVTLKHYLSNAIIEFDYDAELNMLTFYVYRN